MKFVLQEIPVATITQSQVRIETSLLRKVVPKKVVLLAVGRGALSVYFGFC